jgi:predicted TIM-barrel fold metal-dependent hydrolase
VTHDSVPVVSVDDHVIEPAHTFEGRLPGHLADRAPRVVEVPESSLSTMLGPNFDKWDPKHNPLMAAGAADLGPRHAWLLDTQLFPIYGMDSCVGRPAASWGMRPLRFDELAPGSYDPVARVADMDTAGVVASLNFPSMWIGFCGTAFFRRPDPELGLALVRAWNDWYQEEWVDAFAGRFIGMQLPCLWDVTLAAEEVRRNAERGIRAVTFSENPAGQGLPTIHSGYWDPLFAACQETGTVLCLHGGSSGSTIDTTPDAPLEVAQSLFPVGAAKVAVDWLWSRVPVRFPDLKIALSEGGVGWLPVVADWVDHVFTTHNDWTHGWDGVDVLPSAILWRNFWYCSIDEPRGMQAVARLFGTDRLVVEVDYPHADTSWPRTQQVVRTMTAGLPEAAVRAIAYGNACELYSLPVPVG